MEGFSLSIVGHELILHVDAIWLAVGIALAVVWRLVTGRGHMGR